MQLIAPDGVVMINAMEKLFLVRDVPDTLFYRIPDTGYTQISNSTGYLIPDNTG